LSELVVLNVIEKTHTLSIKHGTQDVGNVLQNEPAAVRMGMRKAERHLSQRATIPTTALVTVTLFNCITEIHCRMSKYLASYSGGPEFKALPQDRLSWLQS